MAAEPQSGFTKGNSLFSLLIPKPRSTHPTEGVWSFPEDPGILEVLGDIPSPAVVQILTDAMVIRVGNPVVSPVRADTPVRFKLSPAMVSTPPESYRLSISPKGIGIESGASVGLFRGTSALAQLIRLAISAGQNHISCGTIEDEPRFEWRGYMLDCSRHFQPVETILKIIDVLALYRMSVLHLHLTDDQGWRLDIPELPELARIASRRQDSIRGHGFTGKKWTAGEPHSGYYTRDDIREIVEYATERFIEVIPEIDVPGHVSAVLAAYPDLGCTGGPYEVPYKNGIFPQVLCVGNEAVYEFLDRVISEVATLFPSKRIHLGGDEVPRNAHWKDCPKCHARQAELGLKGLKDLQEDFTGRALEIVKKHGKSAILWSEACAQEHDTDTVGQFWMINKKGAYRHLESGRPMVFSKHGGCYLDMPYSYLSLRRSYSYDPAGLPSLPSGATACILGMESPMWTEWVPDETKLHYQSFPRTLALAERSWSEEGVRNYSDFESRLLKHLPVLNRMHIGYAEPREWNRGILALLWRIFGRNW